MLLAIAAPGLQFPCVSEAMIETKDLHRSYRIDNDIPVMLTDEAAAVDDAEHDRLMAKAASEGISPTFAA